MLIKELVARINKMKIVIEADEHPPPHFHVMFAGENASFSIIDGRRLPKVKGLERYERNVHKGWREHYCTLIDVWNGTADPGKVVFAKARCGCFEDSNLSGWPPTAQPRLCFSNGSSAKDIFLLRCYGPAPLQFHGR